MKRQRRYLLTLWGLLALSALVMAQTYSFSGRVTNERRVAIDGAQVLLSASDSLAAMALTDPEGRFRIDGLARGSYRVAVLLAGYNTFERTLEIKAGDERADFLLTPEARVDLEGVTVTGNRADLVERTATGEIFHLSEKAKGSGDPFIVLREIPRLYSNVGARTVTMANGERPLILVDGNRHHSGIATIDPKEIEAVEVVEIAKARYLKEGYQQVVNIKLRKRTHPFLFWEVATRHNLPWRRGFGVGYFEIGNERYALYGRAVANYTHDEETSLERTQRNTGYTKWTDGRESLAGPDFLGELQFRWMATGRDYIVAHAYATGGHKRTNGWGEGTLTEEITRQFTYRAGVEDRSYIITSSLFHKHTFAEGNTLETTLAYNRNHNENDGFRTETYPDWIYDYRYLFKNDRHSGRLDLDYSLELPSGASLAAGSQTRLVSDRIRQLYTGVPTFRHERWDEYLYADFNHTAGKLAYMLSAGLEAIRLRAGDATNSYLKPRAAASATYAINDRISTRLGYQLTNTPPTESQLNPYNTSTDSLTRTVGNPYLLPSQSHEMSLSATLNHRGWYLTPELSYRIATDLVEPYGYDDGGIYVSSYRNSGHYGNLQAGGSLSYRIGQVGRVGLSAYHAVDYFEGQPARQSFIGYFNASVNLKKWYFGLDVSYRNDSYTALSRTHYRTPDFSMLQATYYITPNFYVSAAIENFLVPYRTSTDYRSGAYSEQTLSRGISASFSPWILIRYTFRKNGSREMKERKRVSSIEEGIKL